MTVSASTQIPKPSDPAVFQRQCKVLFEHVLKDPTLKEFGSSGQEQTGIDLLGRRREMALDHWVGIQCKLTIKSKKLKKGTLRDEATKALTIEPSLREFILVTTASDDVAMDAEAAKFTQEQAALGRDFTAVVWGWQTLETFILQSEEIIRAFSPDAFPHLRKVVDSQERIVEEVVGVRASQSDLVTKFDSLAVAISQLVVPDDSWNTVLDKQVDQYKRLIEDDRPQTALELLEALWRELPGTTGNRIRFRVKANIAACRLRLGEEQAAGHLFLEACEFTANDPKAVPFKVLGLVLVGRAMEARNFGLEQLKVTPENSQLASHLILAEKLLPASPEHLSYLTPLLEADPSVSIHKIDYLRSRASRAEWWQAARSALERFPDHEVLKRFDAESRIDEACEWLDSRDEADIPASLLSKVEEAASTLQDQWERSKRSESKFDSVRASLATNLSTAYRILRNYEAALTIVQDALKIVPNDSHLLRNKLLVAIERGDNETAKQTLKLLPQSRETIVAGLQTYANSGNWIDALELASTSVSAEGLSVEDIAFCRSIAFLANFKLNKIEDVKREAATLLDLNADQVVVPIILYGIASDREDREWESELFQEALTREATLNLASRHMLARIAEAQDSPDTVVDLLHQVVSTDRDSDELKLLTRSFINAASRGASIRFAEAIYSRLQHLSFYVRSAANIWFNAGGLKEAEAAFQQAIHLDKSDLAAHLGLIQTFLRQDKRAAASTHMEALDPAMLKGSPLLTMRLAHVLVALGRFDDGLALGYATAIQHRDKLPVVQLYVGLILPDQSGGQIPIEPVSIDADSWVSIERDNGAALSFVIEEGPDRPAIDHYSMQHNLSRMVLGHKKGERVSYVPEIGTEQKWTIIEHKHKYVALLHDIMSTLNARFPEAKGFHEFELSGEDLTPILEQVQRMAQRDEKILEMYFDNGFPLGAVGALRGKSSMEVARLVTGRGEMIRTCVGTQAELKAAVAEVKASRSIGAVMDSYTAWAAYSLDLLPVLKRLFTRVAISQASVDEMLEWRRSFEGHSGPLTTIGYAKGQHFREEIAIERLAEASGSIKAGMDALVESCEVLAAVSTDEPSAIEVALREIARHGTLDPLYVARSEGLLLLSDDLHLRNLAGQLNIQKGAWLQAALICACDDNVMDLQAYSKAVANLALAKHNYVTFNAPVLCEIAKEDESPSFDKLQAVAAFLCTESASIELNWQVVWQFLHAVWKTEMTHVRRARSANIVLDSFAKLLRRHQRLEHEMTRMIARSRSVTDLHRFLESWAEANFTRSA